jgi:DNA-binding NtrC family response regulator
MQLPRLVVIDGPDVGAEFAIGPEGGGIGRGEGNAVQLSDLSVSRSHCALRSEGDRLVLVDAGSRNRTLVNGKPITEHALAEGDEITVGKTRLAYLPPEGGAVVIPTAKVARVTIDMSGDDLRLRARAAAAIRRISETQAAIDPDAGAAHQRTRRHLAALVRLGDGLRKSGDRPALLRLVCEVAREALQAERVLLLLPDGNRRLQTVASAAAEGGSGAPVSLGRDVVERVVTRGHALVIGPDDVPGRSVPRVSIAAPLALEDGGPGLIYAEVHAAATPWGDVDLSLCACVAHFAAAALENLAARELLQRENRALEERLGGSREFVGQGAASRAVLSFCAKVAPADSTVLLLGESGSGKEMVASAIHYASRRARGPFVCLSCATLSETLLESELFGHEKGAFTGATEKKLGRFELAHGGTLFFDEVGELSPRCQTKLLRVLEERRFERVGGNRPITVDVRVIAATNRDLAAMVRGGEFREDLFYRLSVIQTEVPPLRARPEDIMPLAEHFLAKLRFQMGRRVAGFSPEAVRAMLAHPWPGNVRELRNAVERAVVLGEGELVRLEDLPPQVIAAAAGAASPTLSVAPAAPVARAGRPGPRLHTPTMPTAAVAPPPPPPAPAPQAAASQAAASLRALEKQGILAALAATNGNKAQAAAILEIDRSTLYKKLKEYGIEA